MGLISMPFFVFVFVGLLCYYLTPDKHKWKTLLIVSLSYYLIICNKYILYMLVTILTTYFGTCKIEQIYTQMHQTIKENKGVWEREKRVAYKKSMEARAKRTMLFIIILNFGILGVVKYAGFVTDTFFSICHVLVCRQKHLIFTFCYLLVFPFTHFRQWDMLLMCITRNFLPRRILERLPYLYPFSHRLFKVQSQCTVI